MMSYDEFMIGHLQSIKGKRPVNKPPVFYRLQLPLVQYTPAVAEPPEPKPEPVVVVESKVAVMFKRVAVAMREARSQLTAGLADAPEKKRKKRKRIERIRTDAIEGHELLAVDPCCYCNGKGQVNDHIIPVYRGGEDTLDNLTRSCVRCNFAKNTRSLVAFLVYRANR